MRGYDQYIVKVDGSRRLTRRNRKYLRKFEPYKPDGMNVPQPQMLQDRVAVQEDPFIQLDPIPAREGETPRPTPQSTPPAPNLEDVPHRAIPREDTTPQDVQMNQPTETQQLQDEDVELP